MTDRTCAACHGPIVGKRADAKTCSAACRKALSRPRRGGANLARTPRAVPWSSAIRELADRLGVNLPTVAARRRASVRRRREPERLPTIPRGVRDSEDVAVAWRCHHDLTNWTLSASGKRLFGCDWCGYAQDAEYRAHFDATHRDAYDPSDHLGKLMQSAVLRERKPLGAEPVGRRIGDGFDMLAEAG